MHIIHILYISHNSLISTGATIAPTVTKDTTLLIISDLDLHKSTSSSAKLAKARKLGIKIMPESQWVKLVKKYIKIVNGQLL